MSLREKSAWISLVAVGAVFVPYFARVFAAFAAGELSPGRGLGEFVGATVYLTLVMIVLGIVVEILSKRQPPTSATWRSTASRIASPTTCCR